MAVPEVIVVVEGIVVVEDMVVDEGIVVVEVMVVDEGIVVVEDILLPGVIVVVEVILVPEVLVAACAAAASERIRSAVSAIFLFICFSPWNEFSQGYSMKHARIMFTIVRSRRAG